MQDQSQLIMAILVVMGGVVSLIHILRYFGIEPSKGKVETHSTGCAVQHGSIITALTLQEQKIASSMDRITQINANTALSLQETVRLQRELQQAFALNHQETTARLNSLKEEIQRRHDV